MSALDWLARTDPVLASQITRLDRSLSRRVIGKPPERFLSRRMPPDVVREVLADSSPPGGIFGVGASAIGPDHLYPAIFTIPALAARVSSAEHADYESIQEPTLIGNTLADSIIAAYRAREAQPKNLYVVGLPTPVEMDDHVKVGSKISCRRSQIAGMGMERVVTSHGRCGVEVVIRSTGERAVVTAGHVAHPKGAFVMANDRAIGRVVYADYLAAHQSTETIADVAVVKLEEGVAVSNTRIISGAGAGKKLDLVVADGGQGSKEARILGLMESFALKRGVGCWGQVLITDRAISISGDSGTPVYLSDGSGTVIGHVVAGHSAAYTIIQDIDYILQRGNVTLV